MIFVTYANMPLADINPGGRRALAGRSRQLGLLTISRAEPIVFRIIRKRGCYVEL